MVDVVFCRYNNMYMYEVSLFVFYVVIDDKFYGV